MSDASDERCTDRVWPPIWRQGHRNETPADVLIFDCVVELLADCKNCHPEQARHKTHLAADEYKALGEKYSGHWQVGFYLEKGWNVEVGICDRCLDKEQGINAERVI